MATIDRKGTPRGRKGILPVIFAICAFILVRTLGPGFGTVLSEPQVLGKWIVAAGPA